MLFKMWEPAFAVWVYERTLYQGTQVVSGGYSSKTPDWTIFSFGNQLNVHMSGTLSGMLQRAPCELSDH